MIPAIGYKGTRCCIVRPRAQAKTGNSVKVNSRFASRSARHDYLDDPATVDGDAISGNELDYTEYFGRAEQASFKKIRLHERWGSRSTW